MWTIIKSWFKKKPVEKVETPNPLTLDRTPKTYMWDRDGYKVGK